MTPLRQRMIEDRQRRGLSEQTQEMSVRAVRHLADHDQTAPDQITEEERRDDFLSLTHVKHASRSASTIALCGITCFYEHPLKRDWTTLTFVRPPPVGHHSPTTTALSPHLTVKAEARARDALQERMAGCSCPREVCHARTRRYLPALWTGVPRHMRRPYAPQPPAGHDGHRTVPDRGSWAVMAPSVRRAVTWSTVSMPARIGMVPRARTTGPRAGWNSNASCACLSRLFSSP